MVYIYIYITYHASNSVGKKGLDRGMELVCAQNSYFHSLENE